MRKPVPLRFGRNALTLVAVAVLGVFMAVIVWMNYASQVRVREASLARFRAQATAQAAAVGHFFSERRNDLANLATNRELSAYFDNKALGMSQEYGLWASLVGISELCRRFVRLKTLADTPIYERIAFLDRDGMLLADEAAAYGGGPLRQDPAFRFLGAAGRTAAVLVEGDDVRPGILLCRAYAYRDEPVGYIVAWLRSGEVLDEVMAGADGQRAGGAWLGHGASLFARRKAVPESLRDAVRKGMLPPPGEVATRVLDLGDGPADCLLVCARVEDTPFFVVVTAHAREVLGAVAPWQFLVSTMVLGLVFLGGGAHVLRINANNLVLHARVEESAKGQREVQAKNEQLRTEVEMRRTKEAELAQTYALLHSLINSVPDLISYTDLSGRYLGCNEAFAAFAGAAAEDIPGRTDAELFPGIRADRLQGLNRRVLETRGEVRSEEWITHADGSMSYIETLRTPFFAPDSELHGVISISRDFTLRKQAEQALKRANEELEQRVAARTADLTARTEELSREVLERKEAERNLRIVFNKTHDALFLLDEAGRIIDVNERVLALYELRRSEVLGRFFRQGFWDEDTPLEALDAAWSRVLGGEEASFEWMARKPDDGATFAVELILNRVELRGRTGVLAGVRDISERKRTMEQQEEHQEFLSTIFEGIGAAIYVFDPLEGIMVDCNAVAEDLIGIDKAGVVGRACHAPYPFKTDVQKDLLCPDWGDQGSYEEGVLTLPDGRVLPIARHLFEIHIGGKAHLVQVVFDITGRRNLERKLSMAQKLESIGLLAAGIAHEINTPTQYIGDSVHFVKDVFADVAMLLQAHGALAEKAAARADVDRLAREAAAVRAMAADMDVEFIAAEVPVACDRALDGVQRVASIVLAMKNFSHPGEEVMKAVDVNQAIENTIIVSKNEWKYAAELVTHLDPDLPLVTCLPGGLNQTLLNVIVNAAHAIGSAVAAAGGGKGTITVSTSHDEEFVQIVIADTGCGIPPEHLSKIFDPFFTTKEVGKGTGQGLAIVHDIVVEKHGGSIDVASEPGKGTSFTIRLPLDGRH
ncbi:MAG: PAS domain S-box protein [Desulfovibrionaceae bacterium]|nr:PAS domain S-box protein [Desulfovibrionaceae bacterium]